MADEEINIIATKILVEAQQALKTLDEFKTKVEFVRKITETVAKQMGGDWNLAALAVRDFAQSMGMTTREVEAALRVIAKERDEAAKLERQLHKTGEAGEKAGKKMEGGFKRAVTGVNILRIAMGVLVSQLIFGITQGIGNVFREMIANLRESELAVYNLINAEKKLSKEGVDITPKGLQKMIDDVRELLPILSKIDAEELVARIAGNVGPALKLTEEEMSKYVKTVALAYAQNKALGYSFDEIEKSFADSALTGKVSQGINKYGVKITDLIVLQHAMTMGLVESEEAFKKLDAVEQANIKTKSLIDYAYQEFSKNAESIPEYLKTTDAALELVNSKWSDFLTAFGKAAAPLILEFLNILVDRLTAMNEWLEKNKGAITEFVAVLSGMLAGLEKLREIKGEGFMEYAFSGKANFKEVIQAIKDGTDRAKESAASLDTALDTPTGKVEDLLNQSDDETKKTLEELDDKLRDIAIDAQQAKEDLAVALSQKQEDLDVKFTQKTQDIDTEYQRKEVDAAVDLQRKISDIERDAERDRQRVLDKAREDEQKAEEDHQLKLWELKMRYLMDLEDALHARDARQIIRLQRQYELDKELLEKKKSQEDEERQQSLEDDLAAVEEKKQERLQDAQIEYEQKLADLAVAKARELEELNVWKAREQADLALWYQRELDDIDRQTQQKIEKLLAGYIAEGALHEEQQGKIHEILLKYFGKNKALVDDLVAYAAQGFANIANLAETIFVQAGSLLAGLGAQVGSVASNPFIGGALSYDQMLQNQGGSGGHNYAEGGSVIATRPTRAMFGERGPELATFTPLDRNGRDVNKLFGETGGGGEGTINLDILLSPDLEVRIVENSMDGVANVIARVNRSKV